MRLPPVRFTTRRMMVAVAASAAFLGLYGGRRSALLSLAEEHRSAAGTVHFLEHPTRIPRTSSLVRRADGTRISKAQRDHHLRLGEKYERAARYPWLLIEPDPPGPE